VTFWFGLTCGAVILGVDLADFFFFCPGGTCLQASLQYGLGHNGGVEELAICRLVGSERVVCPTYFESCVRGCVSQKLLFG
jgi:hypothetical protein